MKYLIPFIALSALAPAAYADNIANCEIILLEKIDDSEMKGSAEVASYRPAADFIASIYDDEDGHMTDVDGISIRGVMCERQSIIPSETDYPIITTGVPLSLSQNFESTTSGLITIYFKDGQFQYKYGGPDLTGDEQALLDERIAALNALPHDLKTKPAKETPEPAEEATVDLDTIPQETAPEIVTLDPVAPETEDVIIADDGAYYQEFKVELKPKAEELGIPMDVVTGLVKTNLGFVETQKMLIDGGETIDLLRAPESLKDYTDLLRTQILYNKKGDELPLVEVVDFILIDPSYFANIPAQ